ncbi:MAG: hypothetical protein LUE17_06605, partial [Planctomycetaceae bacterium]|nr:hypothetical protein [Planctomycetaceae bacterium]
RLSLWLILILHHYADVTARKGRLSCLAFFTERVWAIFTNTSQPPPTAGVTGVGADMDTLAMIGSKYMDGAE